VRRTEAQDAREEGVDVSACRRCAAVLLATGLVLVLSGCSGGVTARVDYTFDEGTAFSQSVDFKGVALEDTDVSQLKAAGWTVNAGSTGFSAEHDFASGEDYSEPGGVLYNTLVRGFVGSAGYDPGQDTEVTVRRVVTDYVIAERHDVEIVMPVLDLAPTECPACDGTGSSDCPDCSGGEQECSDCDGTGGYEGWYGWEECYTCDGEGIVSCSTCSGSGTVQCDECEGTGDAPDWIQASYEDGISSSRLDVAINMPGITVKDAATEVSSWKLKGRDIEDAESFTASSFVVNWPKAGIAIAVLLLILALVVWLIVRRIRKAFNKKSPATIAAAPVAPQTSPLACASCGAAMPVDAKFCRACGTPRVNGES